MMLLILLLVVAVVLLAIYHVARMHRHDAAEYETTLATRADTTKRWIVFAGAGVVGLGAMLLWLAACAVEIALAVGLWRWLS